MRSKGTCNGDLRLRPLQVHLSASDLGATTGLTPAPEGWCEEDDEDAVAAGLELGSELELERELGSSWGRSWNAGGDLVPGGDLVQRTHRREAKRRAESITFKPSAMWSTPSGAAAIYATTVSTSSEKPS